MRSRRILFGLVLVLLLCSSVSVASGETAAGVKRETVLDRVVHVEKELILQVPGKRPVAPAE